MGTQRHVIKRQTVEITLAKKENAWQLQQALSRIFQQQLPPLLDRCLSEAGSPDCLHRIDRLELDLGELDSNRLEADILEKMDAALRQALSEQIGDALSPPVAEQASEPMLAHVELFEHFVREGYLPWWADSSQRQLPEKSFAVLLNSAPDALKRLLSGLIHEPRCLQRLISYFDDKRLVAMMALLTEAPKDSAASLVQTLTAVQAPLHQRSRMPASGLRTTLWQSLLQVAVAGEPVIFSHAEFLTAVIVRWAKLQGLPDKTLVGCLQQLLSSQVAINNEWLQTLAPADHISATLAEEDAGESHAAAGKLRPMQPKAGIAVPAYRHVSHAISRRHATLNKPMATQPERTDESSSGVAVTYPAIYRHRPVLAAISNRYGILKKICGAYAEHVQKTIAGGIAADHSKLNRPNASENQAGIEATNGRTAFSDTDALYINNAGLCILWPFLVSFFERLELVQNGHFHNQAAKQCAVSLLHYLSTEDVEPPEYLLPFNKLLCAMDIDEVFDLATPLTTEQIEACDVLIGAVIDNAPILNNMSANGFRGSFLLRQGSLSVNGGSWLLRVERETYDLVLERFPWTWQWIKLPWMEYPLRVEW
jgi:hypothetical protein